MYYIVLLAKNLLLSLPELLTTLLRNNAILRWKKVVAFNRYPLDYMWTPCTFFSSFVKVYNCSDKCLFSHLSQPILSEFGHNKKNSLELKICNCGCRGRSCGAISGHNLLRSCCFRVQAVTCCDLSRFLHWFEECFRFYVLISGLTIMVVAGRLLSRGPAVSKSKQCGDILWFFKFSYWLGYVP